MERLHDQAQKEKNTIPQATRVTLPQLKFIYPFLDKNREKLLNKEPVLASLAINRSSSGIEHLLESSILTKSYELAIVAMREKGSVEETTIKKYFPTHSGESLTTIAELINSATKLHFKPHARIHAIVDRYIHGEKDMLKEFSKAINMKRIHTRVRSLIDNLYTLFNDGALKVSDPNTLVQFEIAMIPRFSDILLQIPLSLDMLVIPPSDSPRILGLKFGDYPETNDESNIHERFILQRTAAEYVGVAEFAEYIQSGPIIINDITARLKGPLPKLYYTNDTLNEKGYFKSYDVSIKPLEEGAALSTIRARAGEINYAKPYIRNLALLSKKTDVTPELNFLHPQKPSDVIE